MSTQQKPSERQPSTDNHRQPTNNQQQASASAVGWVEHHYRRLKENAETYPYVWASYAVVYIGFGLWTTYRWRKLRRTEDRIRVLQARLHKLVEAEESAMSSTVPVKTVISTSVSDKAAPSTISKAEESVAPTTKTDKALPFEDRPI